jgi:Uma2 family endonuclease
MAVRVEASTHLEAGDHLAREEFHRRYLARPDINKAELVEGVVYLGGRVSAREHGQPNAAMAGWLGHYAAYVPAVRCALHTTVILDERNEMQPDILAWRPEHGAARLTDDGYLEGAPQFIVEVAASSVCYDLHVKKEAYRRNGVREYVVWRVLDEVIDWFRLQDGAYVLIEPDADGIVESEQFPGLRIHIQSMLAGDLSTVLARLGSAGG